MSADEWLEVDVTSWSLVQVDNRGKREKWWVEAPDGTRWLRKQPSTTRAALAETEPAVEAFALRLARASGLDAPRSAVATWRRDDASEARGIVVEKFTDDDEQLSSGEQLLSRFFRDEYIKSCKGHHTITRIRDVLAGLERQDPGAQLLVPFARIVAFDAWIGNCDRHQGNWGIIEAPAKPMRLAPLYDPAASLGRELNSDHRHLRDPDNPPESYVNSCRSGFGDGSTLVRQPAVVREIRSWPEWQAHIGTWIASCAEQFPYADRLLDEIPDRWLSVTRKRFARALLRRRIEWLGRTVR